MVAEEFTPKIIGFTCNWCTYAAADLAGTSRMQYPPNLRLVRVMCSGRVSPEFVLKAFQLGADGVFIGGCHLGDCHYIHGNFKAITRYYLLKKMLQQFGIEPERVRFNFISAAEGEAFTQAVKDFTEQLKRLGPLRPSGGEGSGEA
ncbi:MAG: hydrogenase iron-sulfur subunit [Candidatus Hecatellaceae archaeon]